MLRLMVRAEDITQNAAAYRTRDGIAWEVYGEVLGERGAVRVFSFDTMADCCRLGIAVVGRNGNAIEVTAK